MNKKWIQYNSGDKYDDDYRYPPEGVEVAVTDGKSVDVMWIVYSGGAEWCWYNPEDPDGVSDELPFTPAFWMSPEDSKPFIREKNIKMLLEY